jgi:hypothetical protein
LGFFSVLRKLIIYNWPASKLGKFLAWSPPIQVELGAYSVEVLLLRRLVEAEEGRLEIMRESSAETSSSGAIFPQKVDMLGYSPEEVNKIERMKAKDKKNKNLMN